MRRLSCLLTLSSIIALTAAPSASQTIDPNASIVHLRTTCNVDDCFTTTDDLTTWLWAAGRTAPPSAGDRVAVQMGPGNFDPFLCDGTTTDRGYVSIVGSGRQQSRFVRDGGAPGPDPVLEACSGAIHVENCQELDFSHLTAQGQTGVLWQGGGSATWSDVDMVGEEVGQACGLSSLGWYDVSGAGGRSLHYIFGSRAFARDHDLFNFGFYILSAEIWFYGGEILAEAPSEGTQAVVGAVTKGEGDLRLFGTTLRAQAEPGATVSSFRGATVAGEGTLHMHGSIVNASADQGSGSIDVYGITATGANAFVHTPGTAFVLKPGGTGSAERVEALNGATVESPFVWPAGTSPPVAGSVHGSDAFVETDAGAAEDEAHLMIRDASCAGSGGQWRDMATGSCRP